MSLKSKAEISEIFEKAGVDVSKPCVFSCGGGVMATFACQLAHSLKPDVHHRVYDGSWGEWSQRK